MKDYHINIFYSEEDQGYIADLPDLKHCAAFGVSPEKALKEALKAKWKTPQEIKTQFRSASILKNNRVVFNIGGNKYRLIVAIDFSRQTIFIRFIGTHQQYDKIIAEVI